MSSTIATSYSNEASLARRGAPVIRTQIVAPSLRT
jgi:hypothetical protein